MTSHELARKLLEKPDRPIVVVKAEGGGYTTEFDVHTGSPWTDGSVIRIQVERRDPAPGLQALRHFD